MTIVNNVVSVGTAIVQIASPDDNPQIIMLHNHDHSSNEDLFIGGPSVTAASGFHVPKTETITVHLAAGDSLFAVSDSGSIVVHVLQTKI
jgi:hypothetical protein